MAARDAETARDRLPPQLWRRQEAVAAADQVAIRASRATAAAVDAAAMSRAEIAARAAAAIEAEAVTRAVEVAASAETALETVASERRDESEVGGASRVASSVAATVADDVVVQAKATSDAAATVAAAVASRGPGCSARRGRGRGDGGFSGRECGDHWSHCCQLDRRHAGSLEGRVGSTRQLVEAASRLRLVTAARLEVAKRQASLASELHRALGREELALHYQPVYRMDTGALVAVEALLRWHHPTRGLLHPGDFLDAAEGRP